MEMPPPPPPVQPLHESKHEGWGEGRRLYVVVGDCEAYGLYYFPLVDTPLGYVISHISRQQSHVACLYELRLLFASKTSGSS